MCKCLPWKNENPPWPPWAGVSHQCKIWSPDGHEWTWEKEQRTCNFRFKINWTTVNLSLFHHFRKVKADCLPLSLGPSGRIPIIPWQALFKLFPITFAEINALFLPGFGAGAGGRGGGVWAAEKFSVGELCYAVYPCWLIYFIHSSLQLLKHYWLGDFCRN